MKSKQIRLLSCLILAAPILIGATAQAADNWDETEARGDTRTVSFTTTEATWSSVDESPDGRWVTFDMLGNIYRVPSQGGKAQCLSCDSGIATNFHPRFSPDGSKIAFVSDRLGQASLWIANADGSEPEPVFDDYHSRIVEPAWTPDGQSIVAVRRLDTEMAFYRMRAEIWRFPISKDEKPERLVSHQGMQRMWPSVSPDGRYVYFHTFNSFGQGHRIQRVDIRSKEIINITETKFVNIFMPAYAPPLGEIAPEVSPDGRYLTFVRKIPGGKIKYGDIVYEGRSALWLRDLHTGNERILMDPVTSDAMDFLTFHKARLFPGYDWAQDGKSIVISQGGKIRRLDVKTGRVTNIPFTADVKRITSQEALAKVRIETDAVVPATLLRWPRTSPDGKLLAYESAGQIFIWDFKNAPHALAPMPMVTQNTPSWSKDGKWIVFSTWNEEDGGAVWKTRADGSRLTRISSTQDPYLYYAPLWQDDGKIVASRLTYTANTEMRSLASHWEVIELKGRAKLSSMIREVGPAMNGALADGSFYYTQHRYPPGDTRELLAAGLTVPGSTTELAVTDRSGSNPQALLKLTKIAKNITPSPDLKWAAVEQFRDVYILPLTNAGADNAIDILTDPRVRRLSKDGGAYVHWLSPTKIEFFSGNAHRVFDVASGRIEEQTVPQKIKLPRAEADLVLSNATIIVGDAKLTVLPNADLHIKNGRIKCVGRCTAPKGAKIIDASGRYIMPGWVDTHSHQLMAIPGDETITPKIHTAAAYLAYGTTTTSEPGTDNPFAAQAVVDMSAAGLVRGPRMISQGDFIRCRNTAPGWDQLRPIVTLDDAREMVARHKKWNATLLKSYQPCTRTQRQMMTQAAREAGMGVTEEAKDLNFLIGAILDGAAGWEHWLQYVPVYKDVIEFFGRTGAHYSGQINQAGYPNAGSSEYWMGERDWWRDEKARRFHPWRSTITKRVPSATPKERFSWPVLSADAAKIQAAGGFPTVGGHTEFAAIDNHWEVWTLAASMGNAAALRAASYNSAHFLGLSDDLGSLEVDKIADFTVLTADPLKNIKNTLAIESVALRGVLYNSDNLNRIWPSPDIYGRLPWTENAPDKFDTVSD